MKNKIVISLLIAISTTVLLSVCAYLKIGETIHLKFADTLYEERNPSEEITIIAIDPLSTSDEGLGRFYDWSRAYYVQVLANITEYKPKVIGIDLLFTNKSKGISEEQLVELYKGTQNAQDFATETSQYVKKTHPDDVAFADAIKKAGNVVLAEYKVEGMIQESISAINSAAMATGMVNAIPDKDGIVRRIPLENSFISKILETSGYKAQNSKELVINYSGGPNSFKAVSFVDAYNGNFDEKAIQNKIILIGPTDLKLQDVHFTPMSKKNPMPGVEIHANALQTILENKSLHEQTAWSVFAVILILALAATFAFVFLNIPLTVISLAILAMVYTIFAGFSFDRGTILNMLYPYVALAVTYTAAILYRYLTEFREKKFIRDAFGHYLSPDVVKELTKHPEKLKVGGEKKVLTIMFTDIENFTTYSEKMPPEEITALINEYLAVMTEMVLRNNGTLDKYEGDAIMAFFGAPITLEDHAYRACKTALEMRKILPALHEKWRKEGKPLLNFRVGIATGEVLVGNMGSGKRFDYTVMGDTVNLAARLEPANKEFKTSIMVNEETAKMCAGRFNFKELGTINVKGKEKAVKVFTILP